MKKTQAKEMKPQYKSNGIKHAKTTLNKDFIQANAVISDKTQIIPHITTNTIPYQTNEPKEEQVIYNPKAIHQPVKDTQSERGIVAGSHYNNIILEPGVRLKEEEKSKNGGSGTMNQFGRMSLKEYEQMRNHYMKSSNPHVNEMPKDSKSQYERQYIHQKDSIRKFGQIADQNIISGINQLSSMTMPKKNVNPSVAYSRLSCFNWSDERNEREMKDNQIYNEDLFKNRQRSDLVQKNTKRENQNYINNFNNQILSNDNWGTLSANRNNPAVKPIIGGYATMVHPQKKISESNMRTRKKK